MKNDKETKSRILTSAKKEFMEKGYIQASLRNICKNAGVTTGALYFFFKDKEDVFASLVEEPLQKLYEVMRFHFEEEKKQLQAGDMSMLNEDFEDDIQAASQIIHYMYQYYDEFQLILTKAQGSRFEKAIDEFIAISEKHYRIAADRISEYRKTARVDDYLIHWVAHMNIDCFVHMLKHDMSEEEAVKYMESIIHFLIAGWNGLFY